MPVPAGHDPRQGVIVDRLWAVVGSTNFNNRSFGLNDEVILAVLKKGFAAISSETSTPTWRNCTRSRSRSGGAVRTPSGLLAFGARLLERQL